MLVDELGWGAGFLRAILLWIFLAMLRTMATRSWNENGLSGSLLISILRMRSS